MNEFDQYIRQGEPSQQERAAYWRTAIGLQAVDGLQTSEYLKATAIKHIEGEIDIDQAFFPQLADGRAMGSAQ